MLNKELYFRAIVFICESLTVKPSLMNNLTYLYEKDKFNYFKKASQSPLYDDGFLTDGTLEREVNIRRVLGIVLCAEEDENLQKKIMKILEKHHPEFYYAVKKKAIKEIITVIEKGMQKSVANYPYRNSLLRIPYYMIRLQYGFDFEPIKGFDALIQNTETNLDNVSTWTSFAKTVSDQFMENPDAYSFIKKFETLFKSFQRCRDFSYIMDVIEFGDQPRPYFENAPNEIIWLFYKNMVYVGSIFDFLQLSKSVITTDISLSKAELRQILAMIGWIHRNDNQFTELSENEVAQYYFWGIWLRSILKAYQNAKNFYNKNNQETQFLEMEHLIDENQKLQTENQRLLASAAEWERKASRARTDVEKGLYEEIRQLKSENERQQTALKEALNEREELHRLRELAFSLETDSVETSEEDGWKFPSEKKIMLVGGREDWQKKVREKFPMLEVVDGTNSNLNVEAFSGADFVLFFTPNMNHATYNKVIVYLSKNNICFGYAYNQNLDLFATRMRELIETA